MTFDRLLYIDRLKDAGIDESVARAHADALREALLESVATKADLQEAVATLNTKIDLTARDLTIKGTGAVIALATFITILVTALKLFT